MKQSFLKFGALCIIILFAWVSFATLSMSSIGAGKGCVFMGTQDSVCPMNALSHIEQWKQTFLVAPLSYFAIVSMIGTFIYFGFSVIKAFRLKESVFVLSGRFRERINDLLEAADFLLMAFSNGILNPKLYNRVTA